MTRLAGESTPPIVVRRLRRRAFGGVAPMLPILALALTAGLSGSAVAQNLDSGNGRYQLSPFNDGVIRLDTRTGAVSHCRKENGGWACRLMPDERAAMDAEIGRLSAENQKLSQRLTDSSKDGAQKPGAKPGEGRAEPNKIEIPLPSDADIDRAMTFLEKVWRRLIGVAERVQKNAAGNI